MKIKSMNELQDAIDEEISWRKKELTALKSNIHSARNFAKNTALRSGITLLYAHWEGAVKNISTYYLSYVSFQKIPYNKLKHNFLAIAVKENVKLFTETNKSTLHTQIVIELFGTYEQKSNIPSNIIKTNSNLNSEVFKEIMTTIGLGFTEYESKFTLIDEVLLNMRNHIAHGDRLESLSLDENRFEEIYNNILNLIIAFSNQVSNAASNKEYLQRT